MTSLNFFLLAARLAFAGETAHPTWEPMPLDEIRRVYESKTLSDTEIVMELVKHLDRTITMASVARTQHKTMLARDYATLLRMIAERPYPAKPPERPEVVREMMDSLGTSGIRNQKEVKEYLSIALVLAGSSPGPDVMEFLTRQDTPKELIVVILRGCARANPPIALLPFLIARATDSWNYRWAERLGPRHPRRVFPIREAVKKNLDVLGVAVGERRELDLVPNKWGEQLETLHLEINRKSLANRLRQAIRSEDAETRRQAVEAARKIGGDDMKALVDEATTDGRK